VVIIPPRSSWEPIQEIRKQHDQQIRRWMPHITLICPFRPPGQFQDLAHEFSQALAETKPFTITLQEFRLFDHGKEKYTLWLTPEPQEEIIRLQSLLQAVVPDCDEVSAFGSGFVPHLSVGQVKGQKRMQQLIGELQSRWQSMSFRVQEISLISRGDPPDDVFRVNEKVLMSFH